MSNRCYISFIINNGSMKTVSTKVEDKDLEQCHTEDFYNALAIPISIIFCTLFGIFIIYKHKLKMKSVGDDIRFVPGPISIPCFGTRWIYLPWVGKYNINNVHEAYKDLFRIYGSIVKEEGILNVPIINIMDKNSIKLVLRQSERFPFRPPNEVTAHYRKSRPDRYTNLGLVNEQGETWHHLRNALTPALSNKKTLKSFLPELISIAEDFVRLVDQSRNSDDVVLCVEEFCNKLGLETTCTLMLGKRFGFIQEYDTDPIGKQLADAIKGQFCASRDTFYGIPFWKLFSTPAYEKFVKCEDTIYDIISRMVNDAIFDEENTCPVDHVLDVFHSILNADNVDIRDKKAALIDFIAAGIMTLGNTLVFILYLLAKNPEAQQKLYLEIETMISINNQISQEQLREAHYLHCCIAEAFRLLPTAPCLARTLSKETELDGYKIPKDTVILCHTWIACLQEDNFPDVHKYLPERWHGSSFDSESSFLVSPFGSGKRMCPGKKFVEMELQVILVQIFRQFEVEFEGELDLVFEFLLSPAPGTKFKFKNRI